MYGRDGRFERTTTTPQCSALPDCRIPNMIYNITVYLIQIYSVNINSLNGDKIKSKLITCLYKLTYAQITLKTVL